ncbi:MAG: hypothetical protein ACXWLH_00855 [Candidatus Saccharimonadales bacterium]
METIDDRTKLAQDMIEFMRSTAVRLADFAEAKKMFGKCFGVGFEYIDRGMLDAVRADSMASINTTLNFLGGIIVREEVSASGVNSNKIKLISCQGLDDSYSRWIMYSDRPKPPIYISAEELAKRMEL